jgi:hypothetical protein
MRSRFALRVATLVLVVFTATAPAFAAPRDDSPGGIERAITRIVKQIKKVFVPSTDTDLTVPKP